MNLFARIAVVLAVLALACPATDPPRVPPPASSPPAPPPVPPPSFVAPPAASSSAPAAAPEPPARAPGPARPAAVLSKDHPCKGCELRLPPTSDSLAPAPLLVVLHGDLGDAWKMTRVWSAAAQSRGMILLSLRCPQDKGCHSSWWQWYLGSKHEDGWVAAQVESVRAQYPLEPKRIYAAGYSGGASYLGYYAPAHPGLFAAVSHVAGGVRFASSCSRCKTPVHFLIGGQDPMIPLHTDALRRWYADCGGHTLVWNVLPGVTHDSIVGLLQASRARELVDWLMQHELDCPAAGTP